MVKYGHSFANNEHIYHEYICDYCGKHLGGIEIICDGGHAKEHDDIVGWKFCPYCGEPLWDKEPWLE